MQQEHWIAVAFVEVMHLDAADVEAVGRERVIGKRVDGRIFTGMRSLTWQQVDSTEIQAEPFGRLTAGQRSELSNDAARVARTYGSEARLIRV